MSYSISMESLKSVNSGWAMRGLRRSSGGGQLGVVKPWVGRAGRRAALTGYVRACSQRIHQRAMDPRTPNQESQKRRTEQPDLFSKWVMILRGLTVPDWKPASARL